jgi:putative copper export protein
VSAQDLGLIVCDGPNCGFNDLITLAKNLINALIILSTFFATAAFAYAGFILLVSGGSESEKKRAKDIFTKVMWGYLWILSAWLLVYTMSSALLSTEFSFSLLGAP